MISRTGRTRWLVLFATITLAACIDPVEPPDPPTAVEDHEFDDGSQIAAQNLTATQVDNLAVLARVWGFAKYHHPRVVDGSRNWDYELFRAVPTVLAAPDRESASAALVAWLDGHGPVPACTACAQPPADPHLLPDNGWIADESLLGSALSQRLLEIHRNRPVVASQRYVAFTTIGVPDFISTESLYHTMPDPDAGYRLLALFRLWNIIDYWFPYRDVMEEDWDAVLREFIPELMQPLDGDAYRRTLIRLIAHVHDTHANIWSDLHVRPPFGDEVAPVALRFVEGQLVVARPAHLDALATRLERGDVIHSIDGHSVDMLVDSLRPYYPASNEAARLRDIARNITRGTGPVLLEGVGADGVFSTLAARVPADAIWSWTRFNDLTGSAFQMLSDSVAYLKISNATAADVPDYMDRARDAAVLVIDCRGYPSDFLVFALGGHLVTGSVPFARFTTGDPTNPGAFLWTDPVRHMPRDPTFTGKVVILVDEGTQSAAEYLAMAFRAAPGAIVVGSTTAGADGNVARIPLPGSVQAMISGIGVFYPDRSPTQRIGIVPDLVVRPTIAGIRARRREVLDAAVSHALSMR